MEWDLGLQGLGLLAVMALGFGVIAHLVLGRATRWMWLIGTVAYFVAGLFVSEVWFSWATEDDLQPIIDGLAFDEALLISLLFAIPVVGVVWYLARQRRVHGPSPI